MLTNAFNIVLGLRELIVDIVDELVFAIDEHSGDTTTHAMETIGKSG